MPSLKVAVVALVLTATLAFAGSSPSGKTTPGQKPSPGPAAAAQPTGPEQEIGVLDEVLLRQLPIIRRDFTHLILLAPAVADSRTLTGTGTTGLRVATTPQSGLSLRGNNGRGNGVNVDDGQTHDAFGGMRLALGQEAIQELALPGALYTVGQGYSSGPAISLISKSGTNKPHGSVFGLFGDSVMNARNPFAYRAAIQPGLAANVLFNPALPDVQSAPVKPDLSEQQVGGSLGFAIKPDKTFAFGSFDGYHATGQVFAPTLSNTALFRPSSEQTAILTGLTALGGTPVPCLTGQPALPAATCAAILTNILTINPATSPLNRFLVGQFQQNSGLFDFTDSTYLATGRLDHNFNDQHQVFLRYSFGRVLDENPDVGAFTTFARGNHVKNLDHTLQAVWNAQITPKLTNELRLQASYSEFDLDSNAPGVVGIDIIGYGSLGSNLNAPGSALRRHYDFTDSLTIVRGNHELKLGGGVLVRGDRDVSMSLFPGRFVFAELHGGILSPCLQVPAACGITGANPAMITALQNFSLGLPQFYEQGFSRDPGLGRNDPSVAYTATSAAGFAQDSWKIHSRLTLQFGVRYEFDGHESPLTADQTNFAPRVGFSWTPTSDQRTVIRGAYGMFYSPIYAHVDYLAKALANLSGSIHIPVIQIPLTGVPGTPALTSAAVFQTLFAQGKVQGCTFTGTSCVTTADMTQFGIAPSLTATVPGVSVLFGAWPKLHNPYSQQATLSVEHDFGEGFLVSGSYLHVHTIRLPESVDMNLLPAPLAATGPDGTKIPNWFVCGNACFVDPTLVQNNVIMSSGSAMYDAGVLEVNKRFTRHFSLLANYTYSKALDNVSDYNSDLAAFDQTNLKAEHALSNLNQTHQLVVAAVLQSPWHDGNLASRVLSGFSIAPIIRGNSGHPFNFLAGVDVNGDRNFLTDRPAGAARNTGTGPSFWAADLRLSREFSLGEAKLQFMADAFNLANRTNYAGVNNFVGSIGRPFNFKGAASAGINQPLAFTSANPGRQLQLGVRFYF